MSALHQVGRMQTDRKSQVLTPSPGILKCGLSKSEPLQLQACSSLAVAFASHHLGDQRQPSVELSWDRPLNNALRCVALHCTIASCNISLHYLSGTLFQCTIVSCKSALSRADRKGKVLVGSNLVAPSSLTLSFSWRWGWEGWWKWTNEKTYNLVAGWWYLWRYSPFLFADNKPIWEENKWESLTLGALPTKGQLLRRVLAGHPGG